MRCCHTYYLSTVPKTTFWLLLIWSLQVWHIDSYNDGKHYPWHVCHSVPKTLLSVFAGGCCESWDECSTLPTVSSKSNYWQAFFSANFCVQWLTRRVYYSFFTGMDFLCSIPAFECRIFLKIVFSARTTNEICYNYFDIVWSYSWGCYYQYLFFESICIVAAS